jgi:hypothetical protein
MLVTTPLLKWHLEHGMVVTKIYQVVEFTPQRCFRDFVKADVESKTAIRREPGCRIPPYRRVDR